MSTPSADQAYPNTTMAWKRFDEVYYPVSDLFFSASAFRGFMWHNLEQMVQDNVQYVEIRTTLNPIRNLDGSLSSREHTLRQFIEVFQDFVEEHPDEFSGGKLIYVAERFPFLEVEVGNKLSVAVEFRKKYPSSFAGYDLAGQEDIGYPLIDYINTLLEPSERGLDLPFFFHAGETDWDGEEVDINLIDAVLLNSTRIGHGYAVNKHPVVMETIKSNGIAIELNPISNQILHLVHDIRDHVGAGLIADGYPVVISSDDPGLWDALPLSHDFYMAFMGMSAKGDGLSLLKQLVLNSFKYSAMTDSEQRDALTLWQAKWDRFLEEIIEEYGTENGFEKQSKDMDFHKRLSVTEERKEEPVSSGTLQERWLTMIENILEDYRKNNET